MVLDCIGSDYVGQHVRCVSIDGRWALYGLMGGVGIGADAANDLLSAIHLRRIRLEGTTLRSRTIEVL